MRGTMSNCNGGMHARVPWAGEAQHQRRSLAHDTRLCPGRGHTGNAAPARSCHGVFLLDGA